MSSTELERSRRPDGLHEKRMQWRALQSAERRVDARVALLASFTVHPLAPYLGLALDAVGIGARIFTGPFDQIAQELLSEDGETARFAPDTLIVWPRLEDAWRGLPWPSSASAGIDYGADLLALAELAVRRAGPDCTLLFILPAIPLVNPRGLGEDMDPNGVQATASRIRETLRTRLAGRPGTFVLDFEPICRRLGEAQVYDWRLVSLARIPYTEALFDAVGNDAARVLRLARAASPHPAIALDPDWVLWDGDLAEDGPGSVNLAQGESGEPHLHFQDWLASLHDRGARLALYSGQSQEALDRVFARPEMRLPKSALSACVADCAHPPEGIRRLLAILGVRESDLIVLAANGSVSPGRIAAEFPQARVVELTGEPAQWPLLLTREGCLDWLPSVVPPSASGVEPRASEPPSLADFKSRLQLRVEVSPCVGELAQRLAHLAEAVTELTSTGEPLEPEGILADATSGRREPFAVQVSDRFGDYGTAAAIVLRPHGQCLLIDAFMVNCRVLGRDVEWIVLSEVVKLARQRGLSSIGWRFVRTDHNDLAWRFIRRFRPAAPEAPPEDDRFDLPLEDFASVVEAAFASAESDSPRLRGESKHPNCPALDWLRGRVRGLGRAHAAAIGQRITREASTPLAALRTVQAHKQAARPVLETAYCEPRTLLERQLANIWGRVLGLDRVGVFDNFFHIGGQSILATQLLFELEQSFGVELPVRLFFENPTVALMAQTIEAIGSARERSDFDETAISTALLLAGTQLRGEIALPEHIRRDERLAVGDTRAPRAVLLTGATGFLGAFLLRELLERTRASIYCLARGAHDTDALARVRASCEVYFPWPERADERILPLCGDLGALSLGLAPTRWERLAEEIDMVVHGGAVTNFIDPYLKLKAPNVLGTREILRFCAEARTKPLHHISTLYVFCPADADTDGLVTERQDPDHPEELHVGYRQSKWVAERSARIARERGLPVSIYRLGRLSGDSVTGACHTQDFLWRMIRAGIEANCIMDAPIPMDMVPVERVARALVRIMLDREALGGTYHLYNDQAPILDTVGAWIGSFGIPIERRGWPQWRNAVMEQARRDPDSASAGLVAFLPQTIDAWSDPLFFDQANTRAVLARLGEPAIPPIDERVFHRYLDYFTRTGFFKPPAGASDLHGSHPNLSRI